MVSYKYKDLLKNYEKEIQILVSRKIILKKVTALKEKSKYVDKFLHIYKKIKNKKDLEGNETSALKDDKIIKNEIKGNKESIVKLKDDLLRLKKKKRELKFEKMRIKGKT